MKKTGFEIIWTEANYRQHRQFLTSLVEQADVRIAELEGQADNTEEITRKQAEKASLLAELAKF